MPALARLSTFRVNDDVHSHASKTTWNPWVVTNKSQSPEKRGTHATAC